MAQASASGAATQIAQNTTVRGVLRGAGDVDVYGRVLGEVSLSEGALFVASEAHVQAEVRAQALEIEGVFVGNAQVTERISLASTARVRGSLKAPIIAIADGALIDADVEAGEGFPELPPKEVQRETHTDSRREMRRDAQPVRREPVREPVRESVQTVHTSQAPAQQAPISQSPRPASIPPQPARTTIAPEVSAEPSVTESSDAPEPD